MINAIGASIKTTNIGFKKFFVTTDVILSTKRSTYLREYTAKMIGITE